MEKLGKLTFRFATAGDAPLVQTFCDSQNFSNNISLEKMKWDWCLENGAWNLALADNTVVSIAGIHPLPEVSDNSYRCLFRGAQLPGYTLGTGRNVFNTSIHIGYFLFDQLLWGLDKNPQSKFYISTNINDDGGKSQKMNRVFGPHIQKKHGFLTPEKEIMLYYVPQTLWAVDTERYFQERKKYLSLDHQL